MKCLVHFGDAGKLEARAEEGCSRRLMPKARLILAAKCKMLVECNVTFPPTGIKVTADVMAEGESRPVNISIQPPATTNESCTVPKTPPTAPKPLETPNAPYATRVCPPPGYYVGLHNGETVSLAAKGQVHLQEEESEASNKEALT